MHVNSEFFEFEPYENLLFISSHGSWDGRVAKAFVQASQEMIQRFRGKSWAVLHDARDWSLGTPEIEPIISGLMKAKLTGTLTHHVMVTGPSEVKAWQIQNIFGQLDLPFVHRVFQDLLAAEDWLAGLGYVRDKDNRDPG